MAWIESHQDLKDHPKVADLMAAMGWDLDTTLGKLHRFWWWCVDYAEDGDLRKHNDNRIAQAMGVATANARQLVEAMVAACWLDRTPYFRVHDWWAYFGKFLYVKYKETDPDKWKRVKSLYTVDTTVDTTVVNAGPNLTIPNLTIPEGERARADGCAEIPSVEEAIAQTAPAGIPEDFCRFVFLDWSSRSGKDAAGIVIAWLPYVTRRWAKEQVEWKAGTHRGKPKASPNAQRREGVPALAEVNAYAREKWPTEPKYSHWAASFYRSWNDPKRDWKRNGRLIDWKVEFTAQVAKWRSA